MHTYNKKVNILQKCIGFKYQKFAKKEIAKNPGKKKPCAFISDTLFTLLQ